MPPGRRTRAPGGPPDWHRHDAAAYLVRKHWAAALTHLDAVAQCHLELVRRAAGDEPGFLGVCTRLIADLGADGAASAAFRRGGLANRLTLLRVCVLRADAVADWRPLLRLADEVLGVPMREQALAPEPQLVDMRRDWLAARGAVLCRLGRYPEAIASLRASVSPERESGNGTNRLFLAFAHLGLGEDEEARRYLGQIPANRADTDFSWDGLEVGLSMPSLAGLRKQLGSPGG